MRLWKWATVRSTSRSSAAKRAESRAMDGTSRPSAERMSTSSRTALGEAEPERLVGGHDLDHVDVDVRRPGQTPQHGLGDVVRVQRGDPLVEQVGPLLVAV